MKIRYYGHAGQRTGYGRAACDLAMALIGAGADLELRTLAPYDGLKFEGAYLPLASRLRRDKDLTPADIVFVHTLPLDCKRVIDTAAAEGALDQSQRARLVAYTTWEGSEAPNSVVRHFEIFDQVWHPSQASANSFDSGMMLDHRGVCDVLPHCFDECSLGQRRSRKVTIAVRGLIDDGDQYRFCYVGAWNSRKNPAGLVRAFAHAFTRADPVELLLQCAGASPQQILAGVAATGMNPADAEFPRIRYSTEFLADDAVLALHASVDCFVTATRGEAWNLPAFDAMLAGRHIIAPRGLGHDDFLANTSAWRVVSTPVPAWLDVVQRPGSGSAATQIATVGAQGLTSKTIWHEPDTLALANEMRAALAQRVSSLHVDYDPAARFGYKRIGETAMARFEMLLQKEP